MYNNNIDICQKTRTYLNHDLKYEKMVLIVNKLPDLHNSKTAKMLEGVRSVLSVQLIYIFLYQIENIGFITNGMSLYTHSLQKLKLYLVVFLNQFL